MFNDNSEIYDNKVRFFFAIVLGKFILIPNLLFFQYMYNTPSVNVILFSCIYCI